MIRLIAVIYWIILLTLTHIPHLGPIPEIPGKDKTIHFVSYCIGTILLYFACVSVQRRLKLANSNLKNNRINTKFLPAILIIVIIIIAMLDELTQPWVNRTCSLGDWLADACGITLGVIISIYLLTKTQIYGKIIK